MPGFTAVEIFKLSIELNIAYDIIILNEISDVLGGSRVVAELRNLGYTGYIISVVDIIVQDVLKSYIKMGANKVARLQMLDEDYSRLPAGEFSVI